MGHFRPVSSQYRCLRIPVAVAVAVTVDVVDACPVALVLKALELRDVGIARDQRSLGGRFRKRFGFVDERALIDDMGATIEAGV